MDNSSMSVSILSPFCTKNACSSYGCRHCAKNRYCPIPMPIPIYVTYQTVWVPGPWHWDGTIRSTLSSPAVVSPCAAAATADAAAAAAVMMVGCAGLTLIPHHYCCWHCCCLFTKFASAIAGALCRRIGSGRRSSR
jgi:hypothetical protein